MSQGAVEEKDTRVDLQIPPRARSCLRVRSFGLTDRGRVRPSNEDQFLIGELTRVLTVHQTSVPPAEVQTSDHPACILAVADGMGGHKAGEIASGLTLATIEQFLLNTLRRFTNLLSTEEPNALKELQTALLHANNRILEEAALHPEWRGMGTTLTLAFAVDWKLFVVHAGDSRCYLFSQGKLHQLTRDHTIVAELVRLGAIPPEAAPRHPYRHVVTNAVGGKQTGVQAEVHKLDLEPEDVVLLCSDGLTEMVGDDRIAAVLGEEADPRRAAQRLVDEANEQGGVDNITVIVARFERAPAGHRGPTDGVRQPEWAL
jgi:protein phosphatase